MKMKSIYATIAVAFFLLMNAAALPQATLTRVEGKVTDAGKALADAQVTLTSTTGKTFKAKSDKNGNFAMIGVVRGNDYEVEVLDASGQPLYKQKKVAITGGPTNTLETLNLEVGSGKTGQPKMTKEELEKITAENNKAVSMNVLITQFNTASAAKNFPEMESTMKQMLVAEPGRWTFYQALGGAQVNQGEFEDAITSYSKGIEIAQGLVSGTAPKDPKNTDSDPAKAKIGVGQMLTAQGNAYLKLKKNPEAIAAFTKAAEMDPNPGTAYFNICATQYNTGNVEGALVACDKAIAADPNKADAYFVKGSLLIAQSTADKDGKIKAVPGTAEALSKYLELAPDGAHAADVKQMLDYIGSKIETTYKDRGKKK